MTIKIMQKLPDRIRLPLQTIVYGLCGGLAAVTFMQAINTGFAELWDRLIALPPVLFLCYGFLIVMGSSLVAGLLMSVVFPGAAGSGIPQLKTAYWNDMGAMSFRAVMVKFLSGIITLVGGASLGREGPTVFIASGLASNMAGLLGVDRRKRRRAAAAGAAAGLAAAFNTPLAAIAFVLEEVLGDFNSRLLGGVMVASVAGAFVVFALVGAQPSFLMPAVQDPSWNIYVGVPISAVLASLAGVLFQRGCLALRLHMRAVKRIPSWCHPMVGGLVVWGVGSAVFLTVGRVGVFGLGYADLSDALANGIGWKLAGLLAATKLLATIASYGTGGCGGIFSPTLFIGAMCGFLTAGVIGVWVPLTAADRLIIAVTGMGACFGAVVRAPVTAVLMVFEMTHQFSMVPALMLGSLISQGVARLAGKANFYDAILEQDGRGIHHATPPRNLAVWRGISVSALGSQTPVAIYDLSPERLQDMLSQSHFRSFPVLIAGQPPRVVTRTQIEQALAAGVSPTMEKAVMCLAGQTLGEVEPLLIQSDVGLFLVHDIEDGPVTRVFTLHDLIRAQADIFE